MVQDNNEESTRVMLAGSPPEDRTMVAGAPPAGAAPTQMGASLVCPVCQTFNSGLETYCSECGFLLTSVPGTLDGHPAEEAAAPELIEAASGRRFRLYPGENIIGRENCDILLMDGTVSRRHAKIIVETGSITVVDLGSTNGTKVDGNRIEPNQPTLLPAGATVSFGNAKLTFSMPGVSQEVGGGQPAPADITLAVPVEGAPPAVSDQNLVGPPEVAAEEPALAESPVEEATPEETRPGVPGRILTPPPDDQIELPLARLKPLVDNRRTITLLLGTTSIGRRTGNTVVVENDPYISGRHAEIICDSTGCYLVDVGSTNGTLVNGTKLEPGIRQLLLDGDEITMGQSTYLFQTLGVSQDLEEERESSPAEPETSGASQTPPAEDEQT